jgi:hypothetical protein
MSQRETKMHLVTGSLMHLAAKKSFTQLFKYLYPQSRRFLIFSKKKHEKFQGLQEEEEEEEEEEKNKDSMSVTTEC